MIDIKVDIKVVVVDEEYERHRFDCRTHNDYMRVAHYASVLYDWHCMRADEDAYASEDKLSLLDEALHAEAKLVEHFAPDMDPLSIVTVQAVFPHHDKACTVRRKENFSYLENYCRAVGLYYTHVDDEAAALLYDDVADEEVYMIRHFVEGNLA